MFDETSLEDTKAAAAKLAKSLQERREEVIDRLSRRAVESAPDELSMEEIRAGAVGPHEAFLRSLTEDPDAYADYWAKRGRELIRLGYKIGPLQRAISAAHGVVFDYVTEICGDDLKTKLILTRLIDDILDRTRVKLGDVYASTYEEANDFLESVLENIPNMIFVKDPQDLRFVRFNRAGEELLGHKREEMIGKNDYDFFPKEEADFFVSKDREVLASGEMADIPEEEIYTGQQEHRIIHTKKLPVLDEQGNPRYLMGISEDITERKRAEEALERRIKQLTGLNLASQALAASLELKQVLDEIVTMAHEVTGSDYTTVVMLDEKGNLVTGAETLLDVPDIENRARSGGHTTWVINSRQPVIVDDVAEDGSIISQEPEGAPGDLNPYLHQVGVKSLAGLPMIVKGRMLGVLFLASTSPYHFHDQFSLLNTFTNQAAVAIENARLFEETSKRAKQLWAAAELSHVASSLLAPEELMEQVANLIQQRLGLYYVGLFLVDRDREYAVLHAGTGQAGQKMLSQGHKLKIGGESMIGQCVANGQARIALDVGKEAIRFNNPLLPDTHSEIALPLISRGQALGALTVQSSEKAAFSTEDIAVLQTMADQLANAIHNAQLYDRINQRLDELTVLNKASQALAATLDLQETLTIIADYTTKLLGVAATSVSIYDDLEGDLRFAAASGEGAEAVIGKRLAIGQGIAGWVVEQGQAVIVPDVSKDIRFSDELDKATGLTTRSVMCVPLQSKGEIIGVIEVMNKKSGPFDQEDLRLLGSLAATAATAIENGRLFASIEAQVEERTRQAAVFQELIENATDSIAMSNTDRRLTYANRACYELLGYDYDIREMTGLPITTFWAKEVHSLLATEALPQASVGGWSGESLAQHKDGSLIEVSLTLFPVLDKKGQLVNLAAIIRNITEQKRADATLRNALQEREALETVINRSQAIAFVWRAAEDWPIEFVSDNIEQFGYTAEDLMSGRVQYASIVHPDDRERVGAEVARYSSEEGRTEFTQEYRIITKSGEVRWTDDRTWMRRDENGAVTHYQGVVLDITDRKRAEEEINVARQQLFDIIDFLPDATFVIDQEGKVIAWNRAIEELTGVQEEEVIGKGNYAYSIPFYGEPIPILIDHVIGQVTEKGKRYDTFSERAGILSSEVFAPMLRNGQGAYVYATASALFNRSGQLVGAIESIRDISERKRLEERVQESLERRTYQVQTSTDVAQEIAAAPALEELFHRVVTLVKERFGYYHTQVFRADPETGDLLLAEGYGEAGRAMKAAGHKIVFGKGVVGTAASSQQPVLVPDTSQSPDWLPNPHLPAAKGELAVPIMLREQVLGVLDVQSDQAGYLSEEDQLLLLGLCGQIASAVESTRLLEETNVFRQLVENANQGIAISTPQNEIAYANPAFCQLLGAPLEDVIGKYSFTHYSEEAEREVKEKYIPTLMKEGHVVCELPILSAEGKITPTIHTVFFIRDDKGNPLYTAVVVTDISERKRAEEELARRVNQLTALNQLSQAVTASLDMEQVLDKIISVIGEALASDYTSVTLMKEDRLIHGAGNEPDVPALEYRAREGGYTTWITRNRQAVIVDDIAPDGTILAQTPKEAPGTLNPAMVKTGIKALVGLPLIAKDRVLGVLYLHSLHPYHFHDQLSPLSTYANQAAIAIENARLFKEATRRAGQLQAAAEISRAAGDVLDPNELLPKAVDLIRDRFNLYYVGLFLLDENGRGTGKPEQWAVLRAGSGEAGRKMLERGHKLEVGGASMIGQCIASGQARIALDVGREAVRFENPLLPDTHSEMALPLASRGRMIGALTVQSSEKAAFSQEDITVLQTMADQLANTIENVKLFGQTQEALQEVTAVHRQYVREEWQKYLATQTAQERTGYLYETDKGIQAARLSSPEIEQAIKQGHTVALSQAGGEDRETTPKRAVLATPITLRGQPIGILGFEETEQERQWSKEEITLIEGVANRLAVAIENARLFEQTQETLEETSTLYHTSGRISEAANIEEVLVILGGQVKEVLGNDFGGSIYLTGPDPSKPAEWMEVKSRWDKPGHPVKATIPIGTTFKTDQYPMFNMISSSRRPVVISDVLADERIDERAKRVSLASGSRSVTFIPLATPERWLGFIAANSEKPFQTPDERQMRLLGGLANQAAIAVENRLLFEQTQALARRERLVNEITAKVRGSMDLDTIMQTAVQELGKALGSAAFIRLGTGSQLAPPDLKGQTDEQKLSGDGDDQGEAEE